MHDHSSSSDEASSPSLSELWDHLERSRREAALRAGMWHVDSPLGEPDIVPIASIESSAGRRAHGPGSCITGLKIETQGARRGADDAPAPGTEPDDYYDSLRVDTVKLSAEVDPDTADDVGEHWVELKRRAQRAEDRGNDLPTVRAQDGTELKVQPHDPNDNRAVLMTTEAGIVVTAIAKSEVPFLSVEFGAEQCWHNDTEDLTQWAREFAELWGLDLTRTLVSRLDLCTDVDERFYRSDADRFDGMFKGDLSLDLNTDSRLKRLYYPRTSKRPLTFRIYDKRLEQQNRDGRSWWPEVWDRYGIDDGREIWRVEYEAKRPRLKERGIDSWKSLNSKDLERFWSYCTQQFARMSQRQVWERIQQASTEDSADRAEADAVHDPERMELQMMGLAKSIADNDPDRTVEDVLMELPEKYLDRD